jgi:UDP-N-acetylmuramoyl-tripeptide--D-alanyl-D-alanine ligase
VALPLLGRHNVYNALAAVAVALELGISPAQAAASLATLAASDKRGQLIELAGATVINDCYNSNPRALDAMVDVLAGLPAERRIVVAGEMLELGPSGEELHRRCGLHMAEKGIDLLVGVRGMAQAMVEAARSAGVQALFLPSAEEAGEWLAREVHPGDSVLLKASRGVKLEAALETWKTRLGVATPPAQG